MCIKEGLEMVCKSSVHKVNFGKSSMLTSANVPALEAKRLSTLFGFSLTERLGKY